MAESVILGQTAKIDLGYLTAGASLSSLVPLRILAGAIEDGVEPDETTDTGTIGGVKEFFPKDYLTAQLQLRVQLDKDRTNKTIWMFTQSSPGKLLLAPGGFIQMRIWPQGRAADSLSAWIFYRVLLLKGTHTFEVHGSTPQIATIVGIASGYYKRPYEQNLSSFSTPPYAESLTLIPDRRNGPATG